MHAAVELVVLGLPRFGRTGFFGLVSGHQHFSVDGMGSSFMSWFGLTSRSLPLSLVRVWNLDLSLMFAWWPHLRHSSEVLGCGLRSEIRLGRHRHKFFHNLLLTLYCTLGLQLRRSVSWSTSARADCLT